MPADLAAEMALAAAALVYVTETPGCWADFIEFAKRLGGPDSGAAETGVLTREYATGCATDLARISAAVLRVQS